MVTAIAKMSINNEFLGFKNADSLFILRENSKLNFEGPSEFSSKFLVRTSSNAELSIGKNTFFGSTVKLIGIYKISFGEGTRIAFESQVIDSDFHYIYNLDKKQVKPREKEITIGAYNWIGNRTTINKGAITKPFTIVTGSSIINKDYTVLEDKYVVLGGQPAKQIAKNIRRIYPLSIEVTLVTIFQEGQYTIPKALQLEIEHLFS